MWSTIIFGFLQCHHVTVQFWPDLYRSHHHFWYSVGCIQFCLKKSSDELRERTSLTSFHSKEEILSVTSRFPPYQLRKTNRYVPGRRETRQSEFSKLYLRKMLVSQMKVLRSSKTFPKHFQYILQIQCVTCFLAVLKYTLCTRCYSKTLLWGPCCALTDIFQCDHGQLNTSQNT